MNRMLIGIATTEPNMIDPRNLTHNTSWESNISSHLLADTEIHRSCYIQMHRPSRSSLSPFMGESTLAGLVYSSCHELVESYVVLDE